MILERTRKFVIGIFLPLFVVILLTCTDVYAYEQYYKNEDTGYEAVIDDEADLLSDSEERSLLELMEEVTEYGNAAFVSTDENSSSASGYASSYYRSVFGHESGTVFLIDMDNRVLYIYSYGDVYDTVTDSKAETITDNVYKMASSGDYSGCAEEVFKEISTLLGGGRIAQPMKYICNALLAVLIALLINFIVIYASSRISRRQNIIEGAMANVSFAKPAVKHTGQTRKYSPRSDNDHGSSGHSGGGHSGGGHSGGGGGGHKF